MLVVLGAAPMAIAPALAGERDGAVTADGAWTPTAASGQTAETLPTVTVTGESAPANAQKRSTTIDRLPQEIQDTPQSIHVISEETLQQQGVTSLDQALRNVPGVTVSVGEGGTMNGDQFRIRGFDAQNDIYSDGLRDFGVYTRDTFNTEDVQVFLGASGETFGRGNFGGSINQSSKVPVLDDFITLNGELGLGPHLRTTGDVNRKIGDTTAIRLNLMYTDSERVGRDGPESERWGVAPSIGFGLGTDTSVTIAYLHQEDNRTPDYGLPVIPVAVGSVESAPASVDRSNWYGTDWDRDDTMADVTTVRFSHRANDWLQISNDTRVGFYSRDFMPTAPSCSAGNGCLTALYGPNPSSAFVGRGGPSAPYYLDQWGAQNITTGIADFTVGGFKNQFVAGLDVSYENAERTSTVNFGTARPYANMLNPNTGDTWSPVYVNSSVRDTDATNFALFASEQFWFTEQLSLLVGLRWEKYRISSDLTDEFCPTSGTLPLGCAALSRAPVADNPNTAADETVTANYVRRAQPVTTTTNVDDSLLDPKVSLLWEPTESQSYYLSWSKSAQPATGTSAGNASTPVDSNEKVQDLEPTTSETFEIGAKFSLLDDKLGIGVSVYQIERDNAKEIDIDDTITASGQGQRNRGLELTLTGQVTENWTIQGSYSYIDSEYTDFGNTTNTLVTTGVHAGQTVADIVNGVMDGRQVNNVAENSFNIWTTYVPVEKITLGAGVRYHDEMYVAQSYPVTVTSGAVTSEGPITFATVPYYLAFDAMVAYEISDGVVVQANGYNLFDRDDNYDQTFSGRAVPAAGRTVIFSTRATF